MVERSLSTVHTRVDLSNLADTVIMMSILTSFEALRIWLCRNFTARLNSKLLESMTWNIGWAEERCHHVEGDHSLPWTKLAKHVKNGRAEFDLRAWGASAQVYVHVVLSLDWIWISLAVEQSPNFRIVQTGGYHNVAVVSKRMCHVQNVSQCVEGL